MSAKGVNKVILVGNMGQDPEVRYTQDGKAIATLSLATSESWKDQQGQKQEKTEWHRVVIFGKLAEIAQQYVTKGSKVYIEGKLQTRKWQDTNTGQDRYSTEVIVDGFSGVLQMLDSKQDNGQQAQQQQARQAPQQNNYAQARNNSQPQQQQQQYQGGDRFPDDIPY